ncbi:TPA: ATP-dependent helicase [Pseudomonas aeruginosa]|uniref:UvrD-helicase domain-containing protein n=1 Tax=Pseudomonas aeruginosa TaxID=287 RepID=UPI001CC3D2CA|nr:ATP-dependent helicase [Pseudomonas aeruginosa]MBX6579668.1 ATP-dependent helicase [Pseudomonas aeruginosa]MBX6627589.1 ATP-dependent helicase [Pseudomonas aeruginosa]MBZ5231005.1 ATP-dependent helicase [Pseudomonas aeruginosa]MBZ5248089.1 ATP-dependent helicase [Pseudomonas aeruginosa]MCZ9827679.1 ATP-dependent helicase [Pseudomonas aeruginosa]
MIKVDAWKPSAGIKLEPNAEIAATEQQRSIALTAGPGSGKSELLAQRADFLLTTGVCRYPKRILAIAFKIDASNNLKERVWRRCGAAYAGRFDSYTFHGLAKRIIERFRPVLAGADALNPDFKIVAKGKAHPVQTEFKELIPLAIKILDAYPAAVNAIRQTYSDVFLDEFQDCTDEQYKLVTKLFKGSGRRVTAVGDVKQKIMGWAGALEGVFASFVDDFEAQHLNIYRNFRSQPHLLRLQNDIIKVLDPDSEMPAHLLAGEGGEVHVLSYADCQDEATDLAKRIASWINVEGIAPAKIAVLPRNQPEAYCIRLMAELDNWGISYRNENKAQDISTEPIAQVIVDYLLCIYGLREPKAWTRLTRRIIQVEDDAESELKTNWSRYIKEARKSAAADLATKTFDQRWTLLEEFLKMVGPALLAGLSHDYESWVHLREQIESVKKYIDEALAKEPDLLKALAQLSDDQSIRILTVHKSKGLEFDTVVLLGVENQAYFGKDHHEVQCTFFVGVSRAERRLVVTTASHRQNLAQLEYWRSARTVQAEFLAYVNLWKTHSN